MLVDVAFASVSEKIDLIQKNTCLHTWKIVPDKVFVSGICCRVEIVSGEHFNISERPGVGIKYLVNLGPIDCYSEINLR